MSSTGARAARGRHVKRETAKMRRNAYQARRRLEWLVAVLVMALLGLCWMALTVINQIGG